MLLTSKGSTLSSLIIPMPTTGHNCGILRGHKNPEDCGSNSWWRKELRSTGEKSQHLHQIPCLWRLYPWSWPALGQGASAASNYIPSPIHLFVGFCLLFFFPVTYAIPQSPRWSRLRIRPFVTPATLKHS